MPRVRFVAQGNWQGHGFNPGAEIRMDLPTAEAYQRAGQVEILPDLFADTVEQREAAAIAAKPDVDRPGPAVETAAQPKRERRARKK